jgi:hypothetical protein
MEGLKLREHLKGLDVEGKIVEWILNKYVSRMWAGHVLLKTGTSGGLLKHSNESLRPMKDVEFLD